MSYMVPGRVRSRTRIVATVLPSRPCRPQWYRDMSSLSFLLCKLLWIWPALHLNWFSSVGGKGQKKFYTVFSL